MTEEMVGKVIKFFVKPCVAAVEITSGTLKLGDTIRIRGHTTDLHDTISSMQVERQAVDKANPGDTIGIKVPDRVREGDLVYKVVQD